MPAPHKSVIESLTRYPSLWLGIYACGGVMTIATVAQLFGGTAAGSMAGFLTLAGTFGYESLTRRTTENVISKKVDKLGKQQDFLNREIARTKNDVESLKDDMVQTALTLQKEIKKFNVLNEAPVKEPETAMGTVKRSLEKMGNRMRPSFMPRQKPANEHLEHAQEVVDKYKTILMSSPKEQQQPEEEIPTYSDAVLSELINHAVQNDKIEIFAQPIVKLPSRKITYLELFARIRARAGIYLPAHTYRPLAEKETTIENVDHLLLIHTLDTIRADARKGLNIGYFLNISVRVFKNHLYMTDLLEFLRARRDLAPHLIFELQYSDYKKLPPPVIRIIDGLAQLGCKFSLDNVTTLDLDDDMIAENGFSFLKISSDKLVDLCKSSNGEMDLARIKSRLDNSGLKLIVEKFEHEHDLLELLDFEIDYGEGYLFGRPDLEMAYRKHVA